MLPIIALTLFQTSIVLSKNIWRFTDTIDDSHLMEMNVSDITLRTTDKGEIIFKLTGNCTGQGTHVQIKLFKVSTYETTIYNDMTCGNNMTTNKYSEPLVVKNSTRYMIQAYGKPGIEFDVKLTLEETEIALLSGAGTVVGEIEEKSMLVKSFTIDQEDIRSTSDWSYIEVAVQSDLKNKFLDPDKTGEADPRLVARLMLTNDRSNLNEFYINPGAALDGALRLSFSTFGMITLSNASNPIIKSGTWFIAIVLDCGSGLSIRKKTVKIDINVRKDYECDHKIVILFFVSLLGIFIPIGARFIFTLTCIRYKDLKLKCWLVTIREWFWSGRKGLTYLTLFLGCILIVSAFQVVHAKYAEMHSSGDRDICYYNEKCYRPYGGYYDVSANAIASNLPFMVHGVILVIYFSISEAFCRSKEHVHFDYSIPYSIALSFICEGFGSLLYHICPSQIIFQFDTLFMFVVSILMIISIFDGYSIRECDIRNTVIAKHKSVRAPKVFTFFVGPVYFFNFIGNLIASKGLPVQLVVVFYILFAVWWISILIWVAYKLDICPDAFYPPNIPYELRSTVNYNCLEKPQTVKEFVFRYAATFKRVAFLLFCNVVVAGFLLAAFKQLAFSMFILGVLILGLIILTTIFFIPTIRTHLRRTSNLRTILKISTRTCSLPVYHLILVGIVLYGVVGCGVVVTSLVFFQVFSVTDKTLEPWRSREHNSPCFLNDFYDTHDFWHLFASFALMMMTMIVVQIGKPCRECYLQLAATRNKIHKSKVTDNSDYKGDKEDTVNNEDIGIVVQLTERVDNLEAERDV
ncbi:hypothetical protein ACHWQZ_G006405 [Mnemiopsis leidyi]